MMFLSLILLSWSGRSSEFLAFGGSWMPSQEAIVQVLGQDILYRRFLPSDRKKTGAFTLAAIFNPREKVPPNEVSVTLARLASAERTLTLATKSGCYGVARLEAGEVIDRGFPVCHDPACGNDAHTTIYRVDTMEGCYRLLECFRTALEPRYVEVPS